MVKTHVLFGACFLILSTAGALLLTWSVWWLAVVGSSVPARRPFFKAPDVVPVLVKEASRNQTRKDVFEYSLAGGWPSANSYVRIFAGFFAVLASFSFAFIATLVGEHTTRIIFTAILAVTAVMALASFGLDAGSLAKTARECATKKCVTALPKEVLASPNQCACAPDGWFWVTLGVDVVLFASAAVCIALTVRPLIMKK